MEPSRCAHVACDQRHNRANDRYERKPKIPRIRLTIASVLEGKKSVLIFEANFVDPFDDSYFLEVFVTSYDLTDLVS
jgi:hypothetical protein